MLKDFITQLCIDLEITDDFATDTQGTYKVQLDETIVVEIAEKPTFFLLHAKLGPVPGMDAEELLMYLMDGNLFGQGTGGATLSLDALGTTLYLEFSVSSNSTYDDFFIDIEEFANYVEFWQSQLPKEAPATSPQTTE